MREWNLKSGDPLSLTLACDARLGPTDYIDDQIWELTIGGGDPPALSLNTTYGLRAKSVRLFPRFADGEKVCYDPVDFAIQPEIRKVFPNFISVAFTPFEKLDVLFEVWVPHSHAICGRVTVNNKSRIERRIRAEMIGQLSSHDGQRMAPFEMTAATLLAGYSSGVAPVLFMTGGAKAGPGSYPSLALTMQIEPDEKRQFNWVQAALQDREASFSMARELAAYNWDAVKTRIEMLNASQVEVYTGDPSWDAAFMLAQKQAAGLLVGPTPNLPYPSFVMTRQPDQGYSLRGDGTDYNHLWNGQTVLEAGYLAKILLPSAPEYIKGLIHNFLAVQEENGEIDWKPGLGGQRNRLLATPLLVDLVWRVYEQTEDIAFLEEIYEKLRQFVEAWFSPSHDRDQDGLPEWDHLLQTGLDYHPVYSLWQAGALGVNISVAESPALCAMLHHECEILIRIAEKIGRENDSAHFKLRMERLSEAVDNSWDAASDCYFDWDRDTHISTQETWSLKAKGSGIYMIRQDFYAPIRLLIQVRTDETARRHPMFFVHGKGASGHSRVERIGDDQFRWVPGVGQLTGKHVYSRLDRIEVRGLEPEDQIKVNAVNFRHAVDLTLFAPLWAGITDMKKAEAIAGDAITASGLRWKEYGLPTCPQPSVLADQQACWSVNLPWNSMFGVGLLRYGMRPLAAELVERLMAGVIQSLKKDHAFRRNFHAETGQGIGEFNSLSGLAPLGLFLDTLGVKLISSQRVSLVGFNPYPWPITVKYRGMTVDRQKDKTIVTFPDGQTVLVVDPEPTLVSLEA